jgi:hypothetical protein
MDKSEEKIQNEKGCRREISAALFDVKAGTA